MYCPICRTEYREGIVTCSDCDVLLVSQLAQNFASNDEKMSELNRLQFLERPTLDREEMIWLVIRAVGLNVLVFGLLETISVLNYAATWIYRSIHHETSALYARYLGWAIVSVASHAALGLYLIVGGRAVFWLISKVMVQSSDRGGDGG